MKLSQLKIDPEFQSKIPPLQFEEEQQLEQNIIAEGRLLNPIKMCIRDRVTDPHEISNVAGLEGLDFMLETTKNLTLSVYFMLPSCVPATDLDVSLIHISQSLQPLQINLLPQVSQFARKWGT